MNQTISKGFYLYPVFSNGEKRPLFSIVFLWIYLIGVLGNLVILIVICNDVQLHTPMYFFLCNLSFVDICYPTTALPKLMEMLISGNDSITFVQCFSQMYFFTALAEIETIVLSSMAYDRYVAICKPLRYHLIMNRRVCALLIVGTWIFGFVNASFITDLASKLSFCQTNKVHHLFCDVIALAKISSTNDITIFYNVVYVEVFLFGVIPFSLNLITYINIVHSILKIKSKNGRQKAFSTCTSHLTALIIFYGSVFWMYMRPPSESENLNPVFSVLYVGVTPMLNPLIYSLRNKEVKNAVIRTVKRISYQS
ncbi:olfactory receptor 8H1 [Xenopus laevis]|uniref:Olfactory receptor n=2 Tax=Xenopus laevis TaxID=8355 RepID=A0A974HTQ3_XENLA|nr:olfactory receptor 8H1 [Xenopus laevis]OCT90092.1 hypothetical protein XELAEV_18018708mg [Xenopus laevis]